MAPRISVFTRGLPGPKPLRDFGGRVGSEEKSKRAREEGRGPRYHPRKDGRRRTGQTGRNETKRAGFDGTRTREAWSQHQNARQALGSSCARRRRLWCARGGGRAGRPRPESCEEDHLIVCKRRCFPPDAAVRGIGVGNALFCRLDIHSAKRWRTFLEIGHTHMGGPRTGSRECVRRSRRRRLTTRLFPRSGIRGRPLEDGQEGGDRSSAPRGGAQAARLRARGCSRVSRAQTPRQGGRDRRAGVDQRGAPGGQPRGAGAVRRARGDAERGAARGGARQRAEQRVPIPAPGDAPPSRRRPPPRARRRRPRVPATARDEETAPDDASWSLGVPRGRRRHRGRRARGREGGRRARARPSRSASCEQLAQLRREVLHLRGRPESLGTPAGTSRDAAGDVEPDAREEADRLRRQLADAERRADASREEADELRRYVLGARTEIDDAADEAEARYAALREELERQSADVARLEDELEEAETRAVEAETRAVEAETRAVEAERVAALFRTPRDGTDVAPSFSHARVRATPSAAASGPSSFTVSSATHASMETLRRRAAAAEAEAAAWAARADAAGARRRGGDGDGVDVRSEGTRTRTREARRARRRRRVRIRRGGGDERRGNGDGAESRDGGSRRV